MPHLGVAAAPVLLAIVTGAIAFSFAVVDYTRFGRSSYGAAFLAIAIVMGLFTAYHLELVLFHHVRATTEAFGAGVETIIAIVGIVFAIGYRFGVGPSGDRR